MNKMSANRILRKLPRENAFYFFTSIGNYIGENAASLEEFIQKIREVNVKSLEFHLYRGDFQKWINETLEDEELAKEIRGLQSLNSSGDALRYQLHMVVSKHYEKLKNQLSHEQQT